MSNTYTKIETLFDQVADKIFMEIFFRRTDGHDNEISRNIQLSNELDSLVIDAIEAIAIEDPDHPRKFDIHSIFHNEAPINWNHITNQCCSATEDQGIETWKTIISDTVLREINNDFHFMYFYSFFHKNYHKVVYESYKKVLRILNNDTNYTLETENSIICFLSITKTPQSMKELYEETMRIEEKRIYNSVRKKFIENIRGFHKTIHHNILQRLEQLKEKKEFSFFYDESYIEKTSYTNEYHKFQTDSDGKCFTFTIDINYSPSETKINSIIQRYNESFGITGKKSTEHFADVYNDLITENKCVKQYTEFMIAIVMRGICNDLNETWTQSANRFFLDNPPVSSYYTANSIFFPRLREVINTAADVINFLASTKAGMKRTWRSLLYNKYYLASESGSSYILGVKWDNILGNCGMVFPSICEKFSDLLFSYYITYKLPQKSEDKEEYKFNEVKYFNDILSDYSSLDKEYKRFLNRKEGLIQNSSTQNMLVISRTDNMNSLFYLTDSLADINKTTDKSKAIVANNTYLFWGELISTLIEYVLLMYPFDKVNLKKVIEEIINISETDYVIDYYNRYKKSQDPNFKNHIEVKKIPRKMKQKID